jgi:hypothetical protein
VLLNYASEVLINAVTGEVPTSDFHLAGNATRDLRLGGAVGNPLGEVRFCDAESPASAIYCTRIARHLVRDNFCPNVDFKQAYTQRTGAFAFWNLVGS